MRFSRSRSLVRSFSSAPKLPPFDYKPPPYTGPSKEQLLATRKKHMNPGFSLSPSFPFHFRLGLFIYYKNPVLLASGKMQYVFDETGLDLLVCFFSNFFREKIS